MHDQKEYLGKLWQVEGAGSTKQHYNDHKEERKKQNNESWSLNGHIHIEKKKYRYNIKQRIKNIMTTIKIIIILI